MYGHQSDSSARPAISAHSRAASVEPFIARHGSAILGVARRHSKNAADAEDAYQRAFERLLIKAPSLDDCELLPWMLTVTRNEALMIVRSEKRLSSGPAEEHLASLADDAPSPAEAIVDRETFAIGHDALIRLKSDQLRCLLLRAEGLDYAAIQSVTGFSYAKVNRCLSEGRAALREGFERINSGVECRRLENSLSLMADGMLESSRRREMKRHLRGCVACRATLREYRLAPARVAAVLPLAVFANGLVDGVGSRFAIAARHFVESFQSACNSLIDRVGGAATLHQGVEMAAVKKAAAVAAVSASLVAGGVVAEHAINLPDPTDETHQTGATGLVGHTPDTVPPAAGGSDLSDLADHASEGVGIPREPRTSDLIGENAVEQNQTGFDSQPALRGDSVDGPETYAAPLSGDSGSDGSSDQSGELAP